ncbi:hypothetical protein DSC_11870 [Pseudoxanthomonas spadix BD-a59]|uniref:Uncharacterized protein n=1 Tax=Pseudoxanthomonas spadix (strain BD-a59) TaxID=1045855 RepID=G7UQL5_PSEUP|nr:hypothetical protein [Pseudoxanthomonas spadix]AER57018.1 hypothetical protein DSC_11870 [Pseudoxanthomonas spadix BD-a59]
MAIAAINVLLEAAGDTVMVSMFKAGHWSVAGDPKDVLPEDEGTWAWHPTVGVELNGVAVTLVALAGFNFTTAKVGDAGRALLFPKLRDDLGSFRVTQVESG